MRRSSFSRSTLAYTSSSSASRSRELEVLRQVAVGLLARVPLSAMLSAISRAPSMSSPRSGVACVRRLRRAAARLAGVRGRRSTRRRHGVGSRRPRPRHPGSPRRGLGVVSRPQPQPRSTAAGASGSASKLAAQPLRGPRRVALEQLQVGVEPVGAGAAASRSATPARSPSRRGAASIGRWPRDTLPTYSRACVVASVARRLRLAVRVGADLAGLLLGLALDLGGARSRRPRRSRAPARWPTLASDSVRCARSALELARPRRRARVRWASTASGS